MLKIILIIFLLQISISSQAQDRINSKKVFLHDSLSTIQLLNKLNLCEKIEYAESNIEDIIKLKCYSNLILLSISKEAKKQIIINSINGNMIVPDQRLILELKEQFNSIKSLQKCK